MDKWDKSPSLQLFIPQGAAPVKSKWPMSDQVHFPESCAYCWNKYTSLLTDNKQILGWQKAELLLSFENSSELEIRRYFSCFSCWQNSSQNTTAIAHYESLWLGLLEMLLRWVCRKIVIWVLKKKTQKNPCLPRMSCAASVKWTEKSLPSMNKSKDCESQPVYLLWCVDTLEDTYKGENVI